MLVLSNKTDRPVGKISLAAGLSGLGARNQGAVANRVAEFDVRIKAGAGRVRDVAAYGTLDTVRTEDDVCFSRRAVLEVNDDAFP